MKKLAPPLQPGGGGGGSDVPAFPSLAEIGNLEKSNRKAFIEIRNFLLAGLTSAHSTILAQFPQDNVNQDALDTLATRLRFFDPSDLPTS